MSKVRGRSKVNTDGNSSHTQVHQRYDDDAMKVGGEVGRVVPSLVKANATSRLPKPKRARRQPEAWEFTDENPEA